MKTPNTEDRHQVKRWEFVEIKLSGPSEGNPFVDVDLHAIFSLGDRVVKVDGFYDGQGIYLIRFMPETPGTWEYSTRSNVAELHDQKGIINCVAADPEVRGPVRVSGLTNFAYADGTPFIPLGTTSYAWINQEPSLVERTLKSLSQCPFNKLRMCVFPKHYRYNSNEPPIYPFERCTDDRFDYSRYNLEFFRLLDRSVDQLRSMSIECDLILFHPYDRWGFADMGSRADDRYLKYVIARLAAYRNIWWSLANEWDLFKTKKLEDWDRFFQIIKEKDPYNHLRSIHNWHQHYDASKSWVTHVSVQYQNDDSSFVGKMVHEYQKPVCLDECGYEGNLPTGWGCLTGDELVYRSWMAVMNGGNACAHSETFNRDDEVFWWSKGGVIQGESPSRLGFLRKIISECPPLHRSRKRSTWDVPILSDAAEDCLLMYFGRRQPFLKEIQLPEGRSYKVDVIDTWNMQVQQQEYVVSGFAKIKLPVKPYVALRLMAA